MKRIHLSELCKFGEAWKGFRSIKPGTPFATVMVELVIVHSWIKGMQKKDYIPITKNADNLLGDYLLDAGYFTRLVRVRKQLFNGLSELVGVFHPKAIRLALFLSIVAGFVVGVAVPVKAATLPPPNVNSEQTYRSLLSLSGSGKNVFVVKATTTQIEQHSGKGCTEVSVSVKKPQLLGSPTSVHVDADRNGCGNKDAYSRDSSDNQGIMLWVYLIQFVSLSFSIWLLFWVALKPIPPSKGRS